MNNKNERSKTSGDFKFKIEGDVTGGTDNIILLLEDAIQMIKDGQRRVEADASFGSLRISILQMREPRGD